jgi:L-threonylcarbamoyladenylate synthase
MKSKTDIIHPATEQSIRNAGLALANGSLVVIPTETVYGLAANALNPTAATAIFEAKQRPFFDPLICHISDYEMLNLLTGTLSAQMRRLTEAFWPGPLTIVVPKLTEVPEIITAGLTTVAIRMPSHPVCTAVIKAAGVPLAAPSANLFGKLSPTRPEHTLELSSSVHSIIDGGPCTIGIESTIIREIDGRFVLLRPGKITAHQIESALNIPVIPTEETELPDAPGQLPSHYSPNSQVILLHW